MSCNNDKCKCDAKNRNVRDIFNNVVNPFVGDVKKKCVDSWNNSTVANFIKERQVHPEFNILMFTALWFERKYGKTKKSAVDIEEIYKEVISTQRPTYIVKTAPNAPEQILNELSANKDRTKSKKKPK